MAGENRKLAPVYRLAVGGERGFFYGVILLETVTYVFSFLFSGIVKKDIFNVLEKKQPTLGIQSLAVLIALNICIPLLINSVKQINSGLVAKVRIRLKANLKTDYLEKLFRKRLGTASDTGQGEAVSLFRNEYEDFVNYFLEYYYQIPKIFLCLAILVVMFCINPLFAVISLTPTCAMVACISILGKKIAANREKTRKSASDISRYLENVLKNIEYFRMSSDSEGIVRIFEEKCEQRRKSEIRERILDRTLEVLSENSANLVLGVVLILAVPLYRSGRITVGEFVMFEYYYAFLAALPDAVAKLLKSWRQSKVSLERLPVYNSEYEGSAQWEDGILEVETDWRESPVCVKAGRGDVVLINGGTEDERSMLLQRLFQTCKEQFPGTCGYVSRFPVLNQGTIKENICFGEAYQEERFAEVLDETLLDEDLDMFAERENKNVGRGGKMMSGGQIKRMGIARILYQEKPIVFLDGLSETVDKASEKRLIENIMQSPERIFFVASESKKLRKQATRIITVY